MNKKILLTFILGMFLLSSMGIVQSSLDDEVVSYYTLDSITGNAIDSLGINDLTETGTVASRTGKLNGARGAYSSSNYFLNSASSFSVDEDTDFSYSFWIYRTGSISSVETAFSAGGSTAGDFYVDSRFNSNNKLNFNSLKSGGSVIFTLSTASDVPINTWTLYTFTYDADTTNATIYTNGVFDASSIGTKQATTPANDIGIGRRVGFADREMGDAYMDEVGYWNKTLTPDEIISIYNSGYGQQYPFIGAILNPNVTINSPADDYIYYKTDYTNMTFNVTSTGGYNISGTFNYYNLTNVSFWNNFSGSWGMQDIVYLSGTNESTIIFNGTIPQENSTWAVRACNNYGACTFSSNYSIISKDVFFSICNETYPTRYLNISFKDEEDLSQIQASITSSTFTYWLGDGSINKTYTFSNSSDNYNYNFCSNINNTIKVKPYIQYKQGTDYPQRIWNPTYKTYTNTTNNQTLYLLNAVDGIYVTFITVSTTNSPISNVNIDISRNLEGEDVLITQGTTDAAGSLTAWLNPNHEHIVQATKTGYTTNTQTIFPTQTQYTLTMETGLDDYIFVNDFAGLKWFVYPGVGIRNQSVSTAYGFNITSQNNNIVKCKIQIINTAKSILLAEGETIATNSSYCSAETSYTINSTYPKIKGRLLVDLGDGYQVLEDDAYWTLLEIDTTGATIKDWFEGLTSGDLSYFNNNEQHREYTQILLFFLLVAIICAVLNTAGWDIQTSGGMIFLIGIFVWIASVPGFLILSGATPWDALDKYLIAIIYSMFMIGFATKEFYT